MNKPELSHARLEASLDAKISRYFDTLDTDPDVLKQLLADKRSENTRRAYERDVNDFLKTMTGTPALPDNVLEFLHLEERQAVSVVLKYKAKLIDKGLKEATVNRRLAAVKSLVEMDRKLGACHYSLEDIKGEKIVGYRDTTGVDRPTFERVLQQCDRATLAGKRDYALLRLLWGNALRRNEVSQLSVCDFDAIGKTLRILGKGRGTQAETIDLGSATVQAIAEWLEARGSCAPDSPLFIALDSAHSGHRLSGDGICKMVVRHSEKAGIKKQMSPHRIRHSAITAALDATDPVTSIFQLIENTIKNLSLCPIGRSCPLLFRYYLEQQGFKLDFPLQIYLHTSEILSLQGFQWLSKNSVAM